MKRFLAFICVVALAAAAIPHLPRQEVYAGMTDAQSGSERIAQASKALREMLADRVVMALVYLSDVYPVRSTPSYEGEVVVSVPSGQLVQIQDVAVDEGGMIWEKVVLYYGDQRYEGYLPRANLACSDEVFLDWEASYGMNPEAYLPMPIAEDGNVIYSDIEQFPESYRQALTAIKENHPNWVFVKMNTMLDWETVAENELVLDRNLIPTSFPEYMREDVHSPGWSQVSESALKYYLDPRNGLTEDRIFQFEQLTYNPSYHTEEAVQSFLDNTFMAGIIPDTVLTYAMTFWAVGKELGVSPFHLACRVYQEQGQGDSPLISGKYPGYEGWYNYFNIGASGKTNQEVIVNGLEYAKKQNWYNGYYSILGGARIISQNYILAGQDTLYLQKFDVDASQNGLYYHQYMQNVCAPTSEGRNIRKLYMEANALGNAFVFKIPVYENMPSAVCEEPTVSYTVRLTPPEGYQDTRVYLDGVAYPAVKRNGKLYVDALDGNARTAILYQYDDAGVAVGMSAWELSHNGKVYTAAELTGLKDLLTYHGFSIRITGKSGIRFTSGISRELRERLLWEGVDGYHLKEYGTLVMNYDRIGEYPMIKGGEKVLSGLAYGLDADGNMVDQVYQTVEDRYRYTSVLIGLPPEQYKTEFAFRGYIILSKDDTDVVFYGPIVAKSIYWIAEQFSNMGLYPEGSSADLFLKKIISDADALETDE